jgi:mannosyltransferase OCH1-like enzyme
MVVLRMGGAYADIDTEARRPLDSVISPRDTLLAGWDAEEPEPAAAARRGLARRRQLLPWFFAAAPGHPALRELCERVARGAHRPFSNSSVRDTQERTGAGLWTDVVLKHATNGMAAKVRGRRARAGAGGGAAGAGRRA